MRMVAGAGTASAYSQRGGARRWGVVNLLRRGGPGGRALWHPGRKPTASKRYAERSHGYVKKSGEAVFAARPAHVPTEQ